MAHEAFKFGPSTKIAPELHYYRFSSSGTSALQPQRVKFERLAAIAAIVTAATGLARAPALAQGP